MCLPPVLTPPPVFFSFGMPPANSPPSCGAESMLDIALCCRSLWSLLLRIRPGAGGAKLFGAFGKPGTAGAPPSGDGPGPPELLPPTNGADRSFVTVFLSALPLLMSESNAPCTAVSDSS
jgi:hypothetical protein